MDTLEIDAIAQGILNHIKAKTPLPHEGIAILGIALCKLYDDACGTESLTFPQFASDFHECLIASYKDVSAKGTETVQ